MNPSARNFALTAHVASSVGWMGAVAAFLVLSIAGMTRDDPQTIVSAYIALNVIGEFIIVPLSIAALVTGLVQGWGTKWGILDHYWVVTKLVLTVVATVLLLLHQFTAVAEAARRASMVTPGRHPDLGGLDTQLVFDAGAAVVVLLVTTVLSVYKPWGRTRWSRVEAPDAVAVGAELRRDAMPTGLRVFLAVVGIIVGAIVVIHIAGGGLGKH